jgi:cobalamin biosynthesis protein CbiG
MIVAGVGCRRGTAAAAIEEAVLAALAAHAIPPGRLGAIATLAGKAAEPGLVEAARRLATPLVPCPAEALRAVEAAVPLVSARTRAAVGVASVAEAAALVAAAPGARLLGPRLALNGATCAIAVGDGR